MRKIYEIFLKKIIPQRIKDMVKDLINIRYSVSHLEYKLDNNHNLSMSLFYQTSYISKLNRLKNRVQEGKKIKVFFNSPFVVTFGMQTIYECMKESDLFEPYILVTHLRDTQFQENPSYWQEVINSFNFFKNRGYKVLLGYDKITKLPICLEELKADIIFYDNPNQGISSFYQVDTFNLNYLTCYLPYSLNIVDKPYYHYNMFNINSSWKHFLQTPFDYKNSIFMSKYRGLNSILSGYPKLDLYHDRFNNLLSPLPSKIDNGKPIVIFAPHWTIKLPKMDKYLDSPTNLGTFHLYFRYFENLLIKYPDINFVFKPHPLLSDRIAQINDSNLTVKNYEDYIENWKKKDNGFISIESDYINLFKHSSLLITDCGSFIGEWLPSAKPCLYLFDPNQEDLIEDTFNNLGKSILESYYLAYGEEMIDQIFKDILLRNKDPLKEKREEKLKEWFPSIGFSGENIVKYLKTILTE